MGKHRQYRGKYKKQELGNLSEEVVYDVLRDNLAKRNLVEEQISKISVEADTRTGEVCETPWQKMINIGPSRSDGSTGTEAYSVVERET